MPTHNPSLITHFLEKGREALAARVSTTPAPAEGPQLNVKAKTPLVTLRSETLPAPSVRVSTPAPAPTRPSLAFSEARALLADLNLSAGAVRLFLVLHALACHVAQLRGYRATPQTVTFHSPLLVVAWLVGYTTRHLRRLLPELVAAGLVAGGPHASRVGLRSLWDGWVWTVKVQAGSAVPEIRAADWKHAWRPEFEADVYGKTGAAAFMSQLQTRELGEDEKIRAAAVASVVGVYDIQNPAASSSADMEGSRVQDVVYRLGELPHVHARKRPALVGELASTLAQAVDGGTTWRRWWCGVIWRSWNAYVDGRAGELQALGAALLRLEVDRREWTGMRSPGAVFGGRIRTA